MSSAKLNMFAPAQPIIESAPPPHWPRQVFARDDVTGTDKRIEHPARILVVEDDFLVGTDIEIALTEAGFEVIGRAVSAEEAVELAESRPALVVMDVRLAGKRDGIDAAAEIFRKFGIRCVFATAYYDQETRERAKPTMPLGWVQKPFSMVSLVDAVRRALKELEGHR